MPADAANKSFWDRFAFLYTPFMKKNGRAYQKICSIAAPQLNRSMKVLELACGTGQLTLPLAEKTAEWLATDFSQKMVQNAERRKYPGNVQFQVQDATALSLPAEQFDCVVIANALHIMPDPDTAMKEIYRVLKPGGLLIAPTFVYEGNISFKIRILEKAGFKTFHKWTQKQLKQYVQQHGFAVQSAELIDADPLPECVLIGKK